jgi:hypothetical protein
VRLLATSAIAPGNCRSSCAHERNPGDDLPFIVIGSAVGAIFFWLLPTTIASVLTIVAPIWVVVSSWAIVSASFPGTEAVGWLFPGIGATIGVWIGGNYGDYKSSRPSDRVAEHS